MSDTDDLWPANIAESTLLAPATILKQQGVLLGEKTRQLIEGEVESHSAGETFFHTFYIAAPTLNYKYELFTISHGISFYPLAMRYPTPTNAISLASEAALKDTLKEIFSSAHTRNVIQSILAQVRS